MCPYIVFIRDMLKQSILCIYKIQHIIHIYVDMFKRRTMNFEYYEYSSIFEIRNKCNLEYIQLAPSSRNPRYG